MTQVWSGARQAGPGVRHGAAAAVRLCLLAAARPFRGADEVLARGSELSLPAAGLCLLVAAAAAGVILLAYDVAAGAALRVADPLAIGMFAVTCLVVVLGFAVLLHGTARAMGARGRWSDLAKLSAAFSVPLVLAAGLLFGVPASWPSVLLYVYWVALYWVAVRVVHGMSVIRSALVMLGASLAVVAGGALALALIVTTMT
jgi:hypothetical protein